MSIYSDLYENIVNETSEVNEASQVMANEYALRILNNVIKNRKEKDKSHLKLVLGILKTEIKADGLEWSTVLEKLRSAAKQSKQLLASEWGMLREIFK